MTRLLPLLCLLVSLPSLAEPAGSVPLAESAPLVPDISGPETVAAPVQGPSAGPEHPRALFENLSRDLDTFTLINDRPGLSFHKPMYMWPVSYSPDFHGDETEMVYQISLKQRLFSRNLFFGYTQKSFWQVYNSDDSRPFRETNYNPELFYRWKPRWESAPGLGFDLGIDHESNGQEVPDSRSWNRVIGAAYYETARTLIHLRTWYRVPEDAKKTPDDPEGDDNPDIDDFLGYGELRIQQKLFRENHQASLLLRGNPATGKGGVELTYSAPFDDYFFWALSFWHGYGESLIQYDESVTRVGIGVMLAR